MKYFDKIKNIAFKMKPFTQTDLTSDYWPINKHFSNINNALPFITYISKYLYTLNKDYLILLYRFVPPLDNSFIKYPKKQKIFKDKNVYEKILQHLQMSEREFKLVWKIFQQAGHSEKQLKEMFGIK